MVRRSPGSRPICPVEESVRATKRIRELQSRNYPALLSSNDNVNMLSKSAPIAHTLITSASALSLLHVVVPLFRICHDDCVDTFPQDQPESRKESLPSQ
jgi:hypothetical protein